MYNIGLMYESGAGVTRDLKTAMEWYRKAADAGDEWAMLKVGCYLYGEYGRQYAGDKNEAWRYLSNAALHGVSNAMSAIAEYYNGHLYEEKSYSDSNPEYILKWYGRALASNPSEHIYNRVNQYIDQLIAKGKTDRETADIILSHETEHYMLP